MEFGFILIKVLLVLGKLATLPYRKFKSYFEKEQTVTEVEDPLLLYSATELAKMIREKKLKSEVITRAYIQRIKSVNHIINAIVEDRFDQALEEAKNIDALLSTSKFTIKELALEKPLFGVPITIKESCSVKGLSFTAGSTFMKGNKAQEDGAAVSKLREAGAIILLVSTTSELCLSVDCDNLITGKTRNPYNSAKSSGGSSGGEGALIGSGASIAGIGSDLAGSVRVPAMFCGIFGHKPTAKLVPCQGHWPTSSDEIFQSYITIGPITRYAEDLKLMMRVLSEPGRVDFDEEVNLEGTTLCFKEDIGFCLGTSWVQEEIKSAVREAVGYLQTAYAMRISAERFEEFADLEQSCLFVLTELEDKLVVLQDPRHPEIKYNPIGQVLKHLLWSCEPEVTLSNALSGYVVDKFNGFMRRSNSPSHHLRIQIFREKLLHTLGDKGILIMPTYPTSALGLSEALWQLSNFGTFGLPINILGLPSTQVPMGFDKAGMPIGIQVISTPHRDNLCLKVAEVLEKRFGGWKPRFGVRSS